MLLAQGFSYSKDGAMRVHNVTDPVYAPNSYGGPAGAPYRLAVLHRAPESESASSDTATACRFDQSQ
jgi:catalase